MSIQDYRIVIVVALAALSAGLAGCSGGSQPAPPPDQQGSLPPPATISALYGCDIAGASLSQQGADVSLEFSSLTTGGQFVRLQPPDGWTAVPGQWHWELPGETAGEILTIALPAGGGLEIGAVAAVGVPVDGVRLLVPLTEGQPAVPGPQQPVQARVEGISLVELGGERVRLTWTQVLPGDLDFNGSVNSADLLPLARHLGATVDREAPDARGQVAYWLDSDGDGAVTALDSAAIVDNFQHRLAGYVVKQNGIQQTPDKPGGLTVTVDEASLAGGPPPRYSVELPGTAVGEWSVAAVDSAGVPGADVAVNVEQADLRARVRISGIDLIELPGFDFGDGKSGARIIDPADIVGRPTIAQPFLISGNEAWFADLPRDRDLLLSISYLPANDLATGATVQLEAGGPEAGLEQVVASAVPFRLPAGEGSAQLEADIMVSPNPAGGYFVEINAFLSVSGALPEFNHTLLSYHDGELLRDADFDQNYSEEWAFADADRDNVSDAWMLRQQDALSYAAQPGKPIMVRATVASLDAPQGMLVLTDLEVLDGPPSLGLDVLELHASEVTVFGPDSTPAALIVGSRVEVLLLLLSDPTDQLPDTYWAEMITLVDG